jgi:hypothetical protein
VEREALQLLDVVLAGERVASSRVDSSKISSARR